MVIYGKEEACPPEEAPVIPRSYESEFDMNDEGPYLPKAEKIFEDDISSFEDVKRVVRLSIRASQSAATHALECKRAVDHLRTELRDSLAEHSLALIKVLHSDTLQNERLASFEAEVRKITAASVQEITRKTNESGKVLQNKVIVPVTSIVGALQVIAWILQHIFK